VNRIRVRRNRMAWFGLVGLLVVVGASVAIAQETQLGGKLRSGGEIVVLADERVAGDLYGSGGQVRIEGTVEGDLVAMSGHIRVSGEVGGDVISASGNVDVSGQVGGDLRAGAGRVNISGSVGEDVFAGAGQLTVTSSGRVGEDLVFGTGQTTMDGRVEGDVLGATGSYTRGGTVGGSEDVSVAERRRALTLEDRVLEGLRRFVSLLVVAALLLWIFPRLVDGAAQRLRQRPLVSLGVGVLGVVGFLLLIIGLILVAVLLSIGFGLARLGDLVGITIFGTTAALGLLAFLFYVVAAFAAQAAVGLALGRLATGAGAGARRWAALVLGVLVVVAISSLPAVSGWLAFLIAVLGLGAVILELRRRRRPPAEAPAPAS
jgi:cytoskeletal protein CcmA (bactofilin family)